MLKQLHITSSRPYINCWLYKHLYKSLVQMFIQENEHFQKTSPVQSEQYSAKTQAYEAHSFYVDVQPDQLPLVVSPDFQSRD